MKKTSVLSFLLFFLPFSLLICTSAFAAVPVSAASNDERARFSLKASPVSPYLGETVKVKAEPSSPLDLTKQGIRWEWRGGASNFRSVGDSEVAYEAQDISAVLTVTLWDRLSGEDLETAALTVTSQGYALSINNLTQETEKIQHWDNKTKSVVATQGIAVKNKVLLEAVVAPQPQNAVRYIWIPNEGSMVVSQDAGRCTVYRDATGQAVITLLLIDKNNLELGRTQVSFDVSISSEAIERSVQLTKGWERWKKALALREKGEVETALLQAQRAAEELADGGVEDDSLRGELDRFKRTRDNYFKALELSSIAASLWRDGKLTEALNKYRQAQGLHAHADIEKNIAEIETIRNREKERKENSASIAEEANFLAAGGKLEEALQKYKESLNLYSDSTVRSAQADVEGRLKAMQRKTALARTQREIGLTLEAQGELELALSKIAESREIWALQETATDIQRIQSALQVQQRRQDEGAQLAKDASLLESQGTEGQGKPEILSQALEKYRQALAAWPEKSLERSIKRVETHIDRISAEIAQSELLVKEAEFLEREGRMEEALSKYRRSQDIRRSSDTEKKLTALNQSIESHKKLIEEAQVYYAQASGLEKQGKLDEALLFAKKGEAVLSSNELSTIIRRLESAISSRDAKIDRAAKVAVLAQTTQMEGNLEKSLALYLESDNIWHTEEVTQAIQVLRGLVDENKNTEERALELYKEGLILERESNFEAAEEKLQSSLTLKRTPEAEQLLKKVQKQRSDESWIETLKGQPLVLRANPIVPRTGQLTVIRIEKGAWTDDPGLTYRWKRSGNAQEGASIEGGQAYSFYPVDNHPVTVTLTVAQAGTDRELAVRQLSVTAEPYSVKLVLSESNTVVKLWNASSKRLEEVKELATGTDLEVRAETAPLPDGTVSYFWSVDADSTLGNSQENKTIVRRSLPGTSKVDVAIKNTRDIVIGSGQLSFIVAVDKNDIARDLKRSRAWGEWMRAQNLWAEDKRLKALEAATQASVLDPGDPDITNGLSQMKEDLGKMEYSARLLSESSLLLLEGKIPEAEEKLLEAEKLWPNESSNESNKSLKSSLLEGAEKIRKNKILAAKLRSEGEALLADGAKAEALLRFQNSLLLEENDVVSKDAQRLAQEIGQEKNKREEARVLRNKGNAMADKKRYTEAIDLYTRSLRLYPDEYLEAYAELLQEKAAEEKSIREEALKLRKEGDVLMKDKKTPEALVKYKESIQIWHDDELADTVKNEEQRIAEATASKLRKEAEKLLKSKKTTEAFLRYKESLTYSHDNIARAYVDKVEAEEAQKRADSLVKEGDALMKQKKPEEALERYKLALKNTPKDSVLSEKVRKLELILAPAVATDPISSDIVLPKEPSSDENLSSEKDDSRDLVHADALFREGNSLYIQKKYAEALFKYEESYKLSQSQKLKEFIDQLKATLGNMEKASKLVQEGNALYKAQKYKEALNKYRESLKFHDNAEVEAFIPKVETLLK